MLWKTEEWGAGVGEQAPLRISEMFINPHQKVSRAENNYRHFKHSLSIVFLLGFILQRVRWRSIALRTLSDRYFPHNPGLLKPAVDAQHTAHTADGTPLCTKCRKHCANGKSESLDVAAGKDQYSSPQCPSGGCRALLRLWMGNSSLKHPRL